MAELAGTNSIEYYLKGRALRQQREESQARAIIAQQKMEQDLQIAKERQAELTKWHGMQNEIAQGKLKNDSLTRKAVFFDKFSGLLKARQEGLVDFKDPNQITIADPETGEHILNIDNLQLTPKGTAAGFRISEAVNKAKALGPVQTENRLQLETGLSPILAQRAGEVAKAQLPAKTNFAMIQSELAQKAAQAQRDFTAIENQKNRDAMYARTNLINSTKSTAKAEEKAQSITETVDADFQEVLEGNITQEDLNRKLTGEAKVKVQNELRRRGVRILKDEDKGNLSALQAATNFRQKLGELETIINKHSTPQAAMLDTAYQGKLKEIQQDLDAWGRAVKGFKGMITERDTQRLEGGIPSPFPGGKLSIFQDAKKIREVNKARVASVDNFIQQRFNMMTSGMSPKQKAEVRRRFAIPSRQIPKIDKSKPYGPDNPPPAHLKKGQ